MLRLTVVVVVVGLSACQCTEEPPPDGGATDAGAVDSGVPDAGPIDAEIPDAGGPRCDGCVLGDGGCAHGFGQTSCGRNGSSCVDCGAETCVNGSCVSSDGGCFGPVPGAAWETARCPDAGCPVGTACLLGHGETGSEFGCVPIDPRCDGGVPNCRCMGCLCGAQCYELTEGLACDNGTISTRELKRDIRYLSAEEQRRLSQQTLAIPLATYQYTFDSTEAKRRLGFIIEDQPPTSAAVLADRKHVDEYGYTSMLLVTLQAQAKQLAELEARVRKLESRCAPLRDSSSTTRDPTAPSP